MLEKEARKQSGLGEKSFSDSGRGAYARLLRLQFYADGPIYVEYINPHAVKSTILPNRRDPARVIFLVLKNRFFLSRADSNNAVMQNMSQLTRQVSF